MTTKEQFQDWFKDGNVIEVKTDIYSTQDAQWRNRIVGIKNLYRYFIKEFINI